MNHEKIVFVINPSLWYERMYPSGILCLSGYLDFKGIPNIILDSKLSNKKVEFDKRELLIVDQILKLEPSLVCFSASHREYDEVLRMNETLKSKNHNIKTIIGGPQATYRPSDFLDHGFEFVCIGEGEETLYEFVQELFTGNKKWEKIKGLAWKNSEKSFFNEKRPLISEDKINLVKIPPFDKLDPKYFEMSGATIRGLILKGALLLTTRGCPFSCSFCGCNLIFGKKLRFKRLENIEKELKYLKEELGVEGIWIVDDTFTIKKDHVINVSKLLKKYDMVWGCQSRVNTLDKEIINIMKDCGCVQIDLGVESGSQRILNDIIHKKTDINQVKEAFKLLKEYGVRSLANFMIGFPTETCQDFKKTLELAKNIKADEYVFAIATPLPGTELYKMVGEEIKPEDYSLLDWNGSSLTDRLNKSEIPNISRTLKKIQRKYFLKSVKNSFFTNLSFFIKKNNKEERIKFLIDNLRKFSIN